MSPSYYRRRREKLIERARLGVTARERRRLERGRECEGWRRVRTALIVVHAAPDGRSVGVQVFGHATWERCGSERAVRGALARLLWGEREGKGGRGETEGRKDERIANRG